VNGEWKMQAIVGAIHESPVTKNATVANNGLQLINQWTENAWEKW